MIPLRMKRTCDFSVLVNALLHRSFVLALSSRYSMALLHFWFRSSGNTSSFEFNLGLVGHVTIIVAERLFEYGSAERM